MQALSKIPCIIGFGKGIYGIDKLKNLMQLKSIVQDAKLRKLARFPTQTTNCISGCRPVTLVVHKIWCCYFSSNTDV